MMRLLSVLFAITLVCPAVAEQQDFGPWEVHYTVFNSTFIQPEIARRLDITRSRERMLINVSVRRKNDDGSTREQRAIVTGNTSDLIRVTPLAFREIIEKDAVYYIAEFRIGREETLRFRLQIQPKRGEPPHRIEFTKTLYWDE